MSDEKKCCCAEEAAAAEECFKEEACCKKEKCGEKKCCKCCCICRIFKGLLLICFGFLIGVHFRAIKAAVKGEPLPKAPDWHCWVK
ncbi:MAG: hypothetical protein IKQ49_10070 [Eubacterium sp.]|nr:hypothetical protein [Eubacterium sp.]